MPPFAFVSLNFFFLTGYTLDLTKSELPLTVEECESDPETN